MSYDESATQSGISRFGCLGILSAALLVLVLLAFALLFTIKHDQAELERSRQKRREKSMALVRSGRTDVGIGDIEMLEMLLNDPTCRENVTSIYFTNVKLADPRFGRVREFPNLTELSFYCCDNADNVVATSKGIPGIESLFFEVTQISDETLHSLAEFPNLKSLHFEQVMPDAQIATLRKLIPEVEIEAECLESELLEGVSHQETTESE